MAKLSSGRKALVLKRVGKIRKVVTMLKRVKGLDLSDLDAALDTIPDKLDELGVKPDKSKKSSKPAPGHDLL